MSLPSIIRTMEQVNNFNGPFNSHEKEKKIVVVRHFDDRDDLEKYGRDAVLSEGQEDKAGMVAEALLSEIREHKKKAVLFVTSPRLRAKQTAQMVSGLLSQKAPQLKVLSVQEDDLRAIDQGEFVLPGNYVAGQKFEGLEIADQIFFNETHASDKGEGTDNYDYKFGDPVLMENGQYKYPELNKFFIKYGESYRDVLLRLYSLVIETSRKIKKLGRNTELVIVTHGQPAQVFKDLKEVASLIKNGGASYREGELARLCWEFYKRRDASEKVTGAVDVVSAEELADPHLVELLKREVRFLSKPNEAQ